MPEEGWQTVSVRAYAGASYPERPLAVHWRGAWRAVLRVEDQRREPGRLCFTVRLEGPERDDTRLRLCYDYENGAWQALPLGER